LLIFLAAIVGFWGMYRNEDVIVISGALAMIVFIAIFLRLPGVKKIATRYWYRCYLCGYEWSWRSDEPKPQVTIRPDLIAKGEQRLEEERKKRRGDTPSYVYEVVRRT